jgi:hypothetical protein
MPRLMMFSIWSWCQWPASANTTSGTWSKPIDRSSRWAASSIGRRWPKSGESALTSAPMTMCLVLVAAWAL